jgi:hypothetical protein
MQLVNDCEQACEKAADCLDPFSTCVPTGIGNNETTCGWPFYYDDAGAFQWSVCDAVGSPCNIPGQEGGGTCVVLEVEGNASIPLCYQGDPDAGVGADCLYTTTRQLGGFCAPGLFCDNQGTGTCLPACYLDGGGAQCDAGTCVPGPDPVNLPGLGLCTP